MGPVRLVESVITIISHEQLQPALANVTEAMVEKLSDMIEQGDLAERISNRSSDLKNWLMTLDILKVLEGVVELMKTVLRYRWEFLSGNWPEVMLLMDTLMERLEGDYFWTSLAEIMRTVVIEHFVCYDSVQPEDLFEGVYHFFWSCMAYLEPSFKVFSPDSLCKMFNLCHESEDRELRDIIQASKVREALVEIHTPILEVKRALMCRTVNINKKYWEYVLY